MKVIKEKEEAMKWKWKCWKSWRSMGKDSEIYRWQEKQRRREEK
jgi:hypothetical protein